VKLVLAVLLVLATASAVWGYAGAGVAACDIQPGDVPGPQPIRVFPVPAAANMAGAQLLYDNSARLAFSLNYITMANANRVTFPLTAPGITIHTLNYQYGTGRPTGVNNTLFYFTNTETTPADNRFPAHIPRPNRYAMEDYSAVQFVLDQPAEQFGVFVAMNSHFAPGQPPYDDNNVLMHPGRKLWVAVLGEGDTFATAQMQQIAVGGLYAPFIKVTYNGSSRIKSVCVVQDAAVEYNAPFGFFDPYRVVAGLRPGDVDGDGHVDVVDLLYLVDTFGSLAGDARYSTTCDFNSDDAVDVVDLLDLVYNFGT
jgi:hypothetical protein